MKRNILDIEGLERIQRFAIFFSLPLSIRKERTYARTSGLLFYGLLRVTRSTKIAKNGLFFIRYDMRFELLNFHKRSSHCSVWAYALRGITRMLVSDAINLISLNQLRNGKWKVKGKTIHEILKIIIIIIRSVNDSILISFCKLLNRLQFASAGNSPMESSSSRWEILFYGEIIACRLGTKKYRARNILLDLIT